MQPRSGDVFIASPPKCGTTWVCQLVQTLRSRGDMSFEVGVVPRCAALWVLCCAVLCMLCRAQLGCPVMCLLCCARYRRCRSTHHRPLQAAPPLT